MPNTPTPGACAKCGQPQPHAPYTCVDCGAAISSEMTSDGYAWHPGLAYVTDHSARAALCKVCNVLRSEEHRRTAPYINLQTDADTGIYSGYNLGLDADVSNRGEWRHLAKEKGLVNVG